MTHDHTNWSRPFDDLSKCRRCGALVLADPDDGYADLALHDHWHDDVAHQLAQARA